MPTTTGILVAEAPRWAQMSKHFQSDASPLMSWQLCIAFGLLISIIACVIMACVVFRKARERGFKSSLILMIQLCIAHGLGIRDMYLLYRLAVRHQLDQPGILFLRADLFDPLALGTRSPRLLSRYAHLRDQLFCRKSEASQA